MAAPAIHPNRNVEAGERWVWASGSVVSLTLLLTFALVWLIVVEALGTFWPGALLQLRRAEGLLLGRVVETETIRASLRKRFRSD